MRTPSNNPVGTAAQSATKAQFELLGWGVAPKPEHDLGTDLVMARDDEHVDVRRLVGVQANGRTDGRVRTARSGSQRAWGATRSCRERDTDRRRVARQLGAAAAAAFSAAVRRRALARESRAQQDEPLIIDCRRPQTAGDGLLADFLRTRRGLFSRTPPLTRRFTSSGWVFASGRSVRMRCRG